MKKLLVALSVIGLTSVSRAQSVPTNSISFFQSVETYFTSHNPSFAPFVTDSTFAWTGAEYVQGVTTANVIGVEHDLWRSASLVSASTNEAFLSTNLVNGSTFGIEGIVHNEGIAGTVESADLGISYGLVVENDTKVSIFVDGSYSLQNNQALAKIGFDAKKAVASHAYAGMRIYTRTDMIKAPPTIAALVGFSF